eukprot:GILK01014728.1.p1 GENE.GILK01014728.1~~GILK01014728.1.p1  ORF type:complete len:1099 (-),score=210.29 GILK01014728.1:114-3410(-)
MEHGLKIFKLVGRFMKTVSETVKIIVDEFHDPTLDDSSRTIRPLQTGNGSGPSATDKNDLNGSVLNVSKQLRQRGVSLTHTEIIHGLSPIQKRNKERQSAVGLVAGSRGDLSPEGKEHLESLLGDGQELKGLNSIGEHSEEEEEASSKDNNHNRTGSNPNGRESIGRNNTQSAPVDILYSHKNILFRLLMGEEFYIDETDSVDSCYELSFKIASLELLGYQFLADGSYNLDDSQKHPRIRYPLMTVADYKGFRVVATAQCPVENDLTLCYGSTTGGVFRRGSERIESALKDLGTLLNLREHVVFWNADIDPFLCALSAFCQIHESSTDNLYYALRPAFLLPLHLSSAATAHVNSHNEDAPNAVINITKRLRPEFITGLEYALSADAFCGVDGEEEQAKVCEDELVQACHVLHFTVIPKLVRRMDALDAQPYDSRSLTQLLHQNGVNVHCMQRLITASRLPHVRHVCLTDILSRTCKKILRLNLFDIVNSRRNRPQNQVRDETASEPKRRSMDSIMESTRRRSLSATARNGDSGVNQANSDFDMRTCIVDFFNLVLGCGTESDVFWEEILKKEMSILFTYSLTSSDRDLIHLPALFLSMQYHTGCRFKDSTHYRFGEAESPIELDDLECISVKKKSMDFRHLDCALLANRAEEFQRQGDIAVALQALNLRVSISRALDDPDSTDIDGLSRLAHLYLAVNDLDNAILSANSALAHSRKFHCESIQAYIALMIARFKRGEYVESLVCYENALQAVSFHYGPNHPLYLDIHGQLASLYEDNRQYEKALELFDFCLTLCVRILGANHPKTAWCHTCIAHVHVAMGEADKACVAFDRALLVNETAFGSSTAVTAECCISLATSLRKKGDIVRAFEYALRALRIREQVFGLNHPVIWTNVMLVAELAQSTEEFEQGIIYLQNVVTQSKLDDEQTAVAVRKIVELSLMMSVEKIEYFLPGIWENHAMLNQLLNRSREIHDIHRLSTDNFHSDDLHQHASSRENGVFVEPTDIFDISQVDQPLSLSDFSTLYETQVRQNSVQEWVSAITAEAISSRLDSTSRSVILISRLIRTFDQFAKRPRPSLYGPSSIHSPNHSIVSSHSSSHW